MKVFELDGVPQSEVDKPLNVRNLLGATLVVIPAAGSWTLEQLIAELSVSDVIEKVAEAGGADAYLGTHWVGGTEV
ncbi:hypothetical protein [Burkholderia cepacia]|uniref:hypothetical protein n=1 Tax=Burkholderia cepacia TaxID=292 RepID=UPI00128E785D|nr:hypothetical protein [Burkholderia cepacia]